MINAVGILIADSDGHMNWDGAWWMWIMGPLMMVAFVVLIAWLIRAIINPAPLPDRNQGNPTGRAREILAERYASGDINTEEYRERLDQLQ